MRGQQKTELHGQKALKRKCQKPEEEEKENFYTLPNHQIIGNSAHHFCLNKFSTYNTVLTHLKWMQYYMTKASGGRTA